MEDIIQLPTCDSDSGSEGEEACKSSNQHGKGEVEGKSMNTGINDSEKIMDDPGIEEGQLMSETEITRGVIDDSSCLHERVVLAETAETQVMDYVVLRATDVIDDAEVEEGQLVTETENGETFSVGRGDITEDVTKEGKNVSLPSENGGVTEHETSNSYPKTDGGSISGVKRTRQTSEDQQPSVHVKYYDLSRQSKRKLEQLLREWSEWSMKNGSRCLEDQDEVSESGEEIYFPALQVGKGKTSAVSFWMENEIKKPQGKDFVPVEDGSVPLYDRGFALGSTSAEGSNIERGLGLLDAPRCFNCGSYSHSLKECTKPRDIVAVNNSRKQLKSKRNQTAGMRNLTRYYQDSPGGKYEGLRPGVLAAETRRLLGLGEFDPPPWLNRMREIGYPPGYLEADDENLPSGIAIYADEDMKVDTEEGEILEAETTDLPRKMSVKIPGINTPIPENAEERLWAARPANSERHRNGDSGRSNHYSESSTRGRYREYSSRDLKDDDPHGFDRASRYPPRSPSFRKSPSDRERNDPLDSEDSPAFRLYNSFSYNASRRSSEHSSSLDEYPDYSSRSRDRSDRHRHRSGR